MMRAPAILFASHVVVAALAFRGLARAEGRDSPSMVESREEKVSLAKGAPKPSDAARALSLFREGRRLVALHRFAEAREKFEESKELDPGAGLMLNLGDCYEKLGKTVRAWNEYREAAVAARESGNRAREKEAIDQIARLEKSFARVVIQVQEQQMALDGLEIELDEASLPKEAWGEPVPIEAGRHEVRAKAKGRRTWSETFEVTPERGPDIQVPELEPEPEVKVQTVQIVEKTHEREREVDVGERSRSNGGALRGAALVIGGAGIAAIGVGSVVALSAKSAYDHAGCQGSVCLRPSELDAQSGAFRNEGLATVAMVTGAAALVGAAVLWATAPSRRSGIRMQPEVGQNAWGLSLRGPW
jgi:hypothetical protein